ncbi:hypothetical protein GMDG_03854 [Pseudogymnoascus destructans 20631-21]|uniref:Uncharacterized protein n=1 Tax=Pseudogymnoascus destructans (strain ATCC MYA-4855 / 20631-21) TaxID=658429 RepID=L8GB73_PSED2|nr:hypothetical protein GMDG_03854 [Pseudogymnoascus destructans 20631-21]
MQDAVFQDSRILLLTIPGGPNAILTHAQRLGKEELLAQKDGYSQKFWAAKARVEALARIEEKKAAVA